MQDSESGFAGWDGDGMYGMPASGGGMPASHMMGVLSPMLGPLTDRFHLDEHLLAALVGGYGPGHLRGSWGAPTSPANVILNSWQRQATQQMMQSVDLQFQAGQRSSLESVYRMSGYDTATAQAKAANDMRTNSFTPARMMSDFMMSTVYETDDVMANFKSAAFRGGVYSEALLGPGQSAALKDLRMRTSNWGTLASGITKDYFDKGSAEYGGLSLKQVSAVTAEWSKAGGDVSNVDQAQKNIKGYSQALSRLGQLFNQDIPELVNNLNKTFGTSALATFNPKMLEERVLQMKHVSTMTGTSFETLGAMSSASQTMLSAYGGLDGMGANIAMDTAAFLGSSPIGQAGRYLNAEKFRSDVLQMRTGQAGSLMAKVTAGAYLAWTSNNGITDAGERNQASTQARFMDAVSGYQASGLRLGEAIIKAGGADASTLASIGAGEEAEGIARNSRMIQTAAGSAVQLDYANYKGQVLSQALSGKSSFRGMGTVSELQGLQINDLREKARAAYTQNTGSGAGFEAAWMGYEHTLVRGGQQILGMGWDASQQDEWLRHTKSDIVMQTRLANGKTLDDIWRTTGHGGAQGLLEVLKSNPKDQLTIETMVRGMVNLTDKGEASTRFGEYINVGALGARWDKFKATDYGRDPLFDSIGARLKEVQQRGTDWKGNALTKAQQEDLFTSTMGLVADVRDAGGGITKFKDASPLEWEQARERTAGLASESASHVMALQMASRYAGQEGNALRQAVVGGGASGKFAALQLAGINYLKTAKDDKGNALFSGASIDSIINAKDQQAFTNAMRQETARGETDSVKADEKFKAAMKASETSQAELYGALSDPMTNKADEAIEVLRRILEKIH